MSVEFDCDTSGKRFKPVHATAGRRGRCKGFSIKPWIIFSCVLVGALALIVGGMHVLETQRTRRAAGEVALSTAEKIESLISPRADITPSADAATTSLATGASKPTFPDLPSARRIAPGVEAYRLTLTGAGPGLPMDIHLLLPTGLHAPKSLPCVFIAPAGTRMFHGSRLGDDDAPEHLPYALAGFAVVAYELSGNVSGNDFAGPMKKFKAADGGLLNVKNAVDFVEAKVPQVDPSRLFAAGHSSAATMALDAGALDGRFRAVVAYAPVCDVETRLARAMRLLTQMDPAAADLVIRVSPMRHIKEFQCPVFIFHADDDDNVPLADNEAFVAAMKANGKSIRFSRVPTGGHYTSMIEEGIGQGIQFMIANGANPVRTAPQ